MALRWSKMDKKEILGYDILSTNYDEFLDNIMTELKSNTKIVISAVNPNKIVMAEKNDELSTALQKSDYLIPDGYGIILLSKFKKKPIKKRITGIDTMLKICSLAKDSKLKVFLFGATETVIKKTRQNLEMQYPGLKIVGAECGYNYDNICLIKKINQSKADVLFVGHGSPQQELWIYNNKNNLNVKLYLGVGGSFDVISGNIKRAPVVIQNIGLEWLYRIAKQPYRIKNVKIFVDFLSIIIKDNKRKRK